MKITPQGQIQLPRNITEQLGFFPDTEIEYIVQGKTLLLRKKTSENKGKQLLSILKGTAGKKLTTDKIMELTRGE